jgi:hypothetical protein
VFELLTDAERRLLSNTPETGFIPAFIEWAGMKTDAPKFTLAAAAMQALSLACGDNVYLPGLFSDSPTYLNLYILVVGPSTTMRKTTVLNYVRGLLPKNEHQNKHYIRFLDDVSTQAFHKITGEAGAMQAPILLSIDEVAGLFEVVRRKNSYLAGFDKVLMKAYDHSPVSIHRTKEALDVETGAFVNVFAASTPEPLMGALNSDDVESGLLPRFIIFDAREAQRGRRVPLMERRKNDERWADRKAELQDFLYSIARNRANGIPIASDLDAGTAQYPTTEIPISDEALIRFDAIDEVITRESGSDSTGWGAIKSRAFWHIVKLAGLFAISRDGIEAEVQLIDALRATELVEETVADLLKMSDEVGATVLERRISETVELIDSTAKAELAASVIASRFSLSSRDLGELRSTMESRDLIEVGTNPKGRTTWRLLSRTVDRSDS